MYKNNSWEFVNEVTPHITGGSGLSPAWMGFAANPTIPDELFVGGIGYETIKNIDSYSEVDANSGVVKLGSRARGSRTLGFHDDVHDAVYQPNTVPNPLVFVAHHGGVGAKDMSLGINQGWQLKSTGLNTALIWQVDVSKIHPDLFFSGHQDCGFNITKANNQNVLEWYTANQGGDGYGVQIAEEDHENDNYTLFGTDNNTWYALHRFSGFKNAIHIPVSGFTNVFLNEPITYMNCGNITSCHICTTSTNTNHCFRTKHPGVFKLETDPVTGKKYFGLMEVYEMKILNPIVPVSGEDVWELKTDLYKTQGWFESNSVIDFKIAPSNNNYIYVVTTSAQGWKNGVLENTSPALYRSKVGFVSVSTPDGDNSYKNFENISPNLPTIYNSEKAVCTSIAVSPTDENKIWVSFTGYDSFVKVWYSEDAGDSWHNADPNESLYNLPVNDIVYQEGSNDRLFIATDAGVYYKDNSMTCWERYGDIPNVRVVKMKINPCSNKLVAATFGRGVWQADLPEANPTTLFTEITTPTTWSNLRHELKNIRVKSGVTLTVEATLYMPANSKIEVEPGAQLIVNGGTITNNCNALWQGIEVHGNSHLPQNTLNQGRVDVINGDTIEYARNAIRTIATDAQGNLLWNQTGGMVYTNNAVFKDCRVGVSFITYHSFAPTNPNHEIKYKSAIRNSQFITTQELPQGVKPYAGVVMLDVNAIPLTGNTFENQRADLSTLPVTERGSGIVTVDAQYTATGTYNIFNGDLHPGTGNNFNHLFMGIQAYGGTGRLDLTVKDNTFANNAYGIHLSGSNYGLIARNGFTVPGATFSPQSHNFGFGIYAESAYGFNLEENTFNNLSGNTLDNQAVHVVNSSTITGGKVYRNAITGVNYGTQMTYDNSFLTVDCNTYTKTKQSVFDVHLAIGQLVTQGNCATIPVNNTFNGPCNNFTLAQVYRNPGTQNFQYNYQSGTLSPACHNVLVTNCGPATNSCPSQIINPFVVSKSDAVSTLKSTIVGLNEDLAQERAKIDGGNTPHLLHLIATASPGAIKDALMAASPYLSDQVLLAFLAGNPPTGHLKDILLANSPLSEEVREALSGITLPSGIRNQINSAQQGISPRQELEATINVLNTRRINEIDALTREYLDTNWLDSAVIFLRAEGSFEALCALMPLQTRSDTTATRATIDSLSHEATCRELIDPHCRVAANLRGFCQFHQAAMRIVARPGGYFSFTPDERSLLDSLAQTDLAIAVNARSILHFVDGVRYAPEGDYAYYNLAMIPFENPEEEPLPPVTFDIMPNPTSGQVTFGVDPATLTNAGILITDLTGKVVRVVEITHSTPTADLTGLPQGTYLCALVNQNSTLSVKKVVYVR
ncbi:MAG: T9SS type A sorting domain-containing protein [Flavobacteriales bacterium]